MYINLYKRFLEYATYKFKFLDKCSDLSSQITLHLVKVLLYPNSEAKQHWKVEIFGHVGVLLLADLKNGIKKKTKAVTKALIDDSPWFNEENRDFSSGFKKLVRIEVLDKNGKPERQFDEELKDEVLELLHILAEYVSEESDDFKNILDNL